MRPEPLEVLLAIRSIDDDEEPLATPVNDEVVDDPTLLVAQEVVLGLAVDERRDVVGDQVLEERRRRLPRDAEAAHVRDVEQAGGAADREMLVSDVADMLGHLPAAEIDHARAERDVAVAERRAPQRPSRPPPCSRN